MVLGEIFYIFEQACFRNDLLGMVSRECTGGGGGGGVGPLKPVN